MVAPVPAKMRAKVKPKQKLTAKPVEKPRERCARCGVVISRRATPCVWHEHIVCGHCHSKLRAYEPAMAFCPGAKPVFRYARGAQEGPRRHGFGAFFASVGRKLVGIH